MKSAIVVAIIVIACIMIYYFIRKQKIVKKINNNEKYKVPLSDDVQKIYYDNFEKQQSEHNKTSEEQENKDQNSAS